LSGSAPEKEKDMKLTPLDILQQRFKVTWRGFDRQEVETFLELVSEDVGSLLQECASLKAELEKCEGLLVDFRQNERVIQQTIMSTQKVSEDLKRNAQREAELIISEAKVAAGRIMNDTRAQAEKLIGESRNEIAQLTKEVNDLKNRKVQYEMAFKSLLESQLRSLNREPEGNKS
jgi:cell division initiation protein